MSNTLASAIQTTTVLPRRVRLLLHSVDIWVFIGDMPALLQRPDSPVYWKISDMVQVKENVWFHPGNISQKDLLRAAGHFPSKVDYAVPQEWYDLPEIKHRVKSGDHPMWSYEKEHVWGAPLWLSEVYEDLKHEIMTVLPEGV